MRLLEKRPADRPQSAQEVTQELNLLSLPRRRLPLLAILGIYAGCALVVLGLAYLAMVQLGLPDWVMPGASLLLLIGLPIILATALVQGRRMRAARGALRSGHLRPKHWLTWRRAISGGVLAFSGLGVVVAGYMAMRALGIGPVGTLLAAGVLKQRERVLLADFENRTRDSLLGTVVTEAFRIDLAGSPIVWLVPTEQVIEIMTRMRREVGPRLDRALAREVAIRDNIRVVVTGEVATAGTQYVLSAVLLSPRTGEVLAAERETATDSTKIIDTVDRLSTKLRAKIGESLKSLRAEPRLGRVTTSSLEALRKYTQAKRIEAGEGHNSRAIALYEEAIALDTGFASAYSSLGNSLFNLDERDRAVRALTEAFARRDRLSDLERYETIGLYYGLVEYQPEKAIAAYRALLDIKPDAASARTSLGTTYLEQRQYAAAETLFHRAIHLDREQSLPPSWEDYTNLTWAQVGLGHWEDAELTLKQASKLFTGHPQIDLYATHLAISQRDYASAEAHAGLMRAHGGEDSYVLSLSNNTLAQIAALQGKLAEAERSARDWMETSAKAGDGGGYLSGAIFIAILHSRFRRAPERGLKVVARALAKFPLSSLKPLDRPYLELANLYAVAGKPKLARATLAEYEQTVDPALRRDRESDRHAALGELSLAEGRPQNAVVEFRAAASLGLWCATCGLAGLGRAYKAAGEPDSSIAAYERYVGTPYIARIDTDALQLAEVYKDLGELYAGRNDRKKAALYYTRFTELWRNCDQEFKPQVAEMKRLLSGLGKE